jgi:hypothetical protein
MPPPEVSVIEVQPKDLSTTYEYVGQTAGSREVNKGVHDLCPFFVRWRVPQARECVFIFDFGKQK